MKEIKCPFCGKKVNFKYLEQMIEDKEAVILVPNELLEEMKNNPDKFSIMNKPKLKRKCSKTKIKSK